MKVRNLKINKTLLTLLIGSSITLFGCGFDNEKINEEKTITTEKNVKDYNLIIETTYPKNTYGYLLKTSELKETFDGEKTIKKIEEYQKVKLIKKDNDYIYVNFNGNKGYIKSEDIEEFDKDFVDVDISDQKVRYYNNEGKLKIKSSVVTGLESSSDRRTPTGIYEIYYKETDRDLKGANYTSHVNYWMPFYEGYGLHDAVWRSQFGGEIYKTNGSHGCVNLPLDIADDIYDNVNVGTKVLIHK